MREPPLLDAVIVLLVRGHPSFPPEAPRDHWRAQRHGLAAFEHELDEPPTGLRAADHGLDVPPRNDPQTEAAHEHVLGQEVDTARSQPQGLHHQGAADD